ncbi:SGNH/GDSL hydrolase family protein [Demequina gelatinilytica]|uniref:SGNH/GDSL hydrolase family protein n=1 Tax=Demequina gelatinilytica TaxID=1638980 RepID=UPI000780577D|nr:SGNH/GDSL hydrolase family protein [Demequina gelatinilytica]
MITTPLSEAIVRGVAELEPTDRGLRLHRLPAWARRQLPDPQLLSMEAQPAGARVVFRTSATRVELETLTSRAVYVGAERPRGRVDAYVDGVPIASDALTEGDRVEVDLATGATAAYAGRTHTTTLTGLADADKRIELWLPHNEAVTLVALRTDAPVQPAPSAAPLWIHHGSSISQGSAALAPSRTWTAVAARAAGLDLRNLGFGGAAMVDAAVARVIRDSPADVISVKLGINVVNADAMRMRAFVPAVHGFLDTIRDGHPDTPLLLVTPLHCGIHERTPGPGAFDPRSLGTEQVRFIATGDPADVAQGRLTLETIRAALTDVAARRDDDPHLRWVDGTALYGPEDEAAHPLPDRLHPDAPTHELIGTRFAAEVGALASARRAGPR